MFRMLEWINLLLFCQVAFKEMFQVLFVSGQEVVKWQLLGDPVKTERRRSVYPPTPSHHPPKLAVRKFLTFLPETNLTKNYFSYVSYARVNKTLTNLICVFISNFFQHSSSLAEPRLRLSLSFFSYFLFGADSLKNLEKIIFEKDQWTTGLPKPSRTERK